MTSLTKSDFNIARIRGDLDKFTIIEMIAQGESYIDSVDEGCFDLANVSKCDSSGIALLLRWCRYAKKQNKVIRFTHVPKHVRALARVCALERIIVMES